jgi:hypothetical protein
MHLAHAWDAHAHERESQRGAGMQVTNRTEDLPPTIKTVRKRELGRAAHDVPC